MIDSKKISFANFNVTVGKNGDPLLKWLDNYILPALQSSYIRVSNKGKTKYRFKDVKIEQLDDEFAVTGILIKDTILEVLTKYEENADELQETDEYYKSSPYSIFIILLRNHRMLLVQNQSGSPDLRTFSATAIDAIKNYRREYNENIRATIDDVEIRKQKCIPYCVLDVKGIKSQESLEEVFSNVKRVNKLRFKLKQRNNDLDGLENLADVLEEQVLKRSGAKTVQVTTGSIESVDKAVQLIEEANDIFDVDANVEYFSEDINDEGKEVKRKGVIRDDEMSEKTEISVEGTLKNAIHQIFTKIKGKSSLFVKTPNEEEYNEYLTEREGDV